MRSRSIHSAPPDKLQHLGFSCFSGRPDPAVTHRHAEIELMVAENTPLIFEYAERRKKVAPGCLVVMWGIRLHHAVVVRASTICHLVRLPLAWVLQWKLPPLLVQRMLGAEPLIGRSRHTPCSDL